MIEGPARVVTIAGIDGIIRALRRSGRTVIGPTVRGDVIALQPISGAADLPTGVTEEQNGGSYRLVTTDTEEVFAFSSPSTSWKRFVYPEKTLLLRARRRDGSVEIDPPSPAPPSLAFFGIRSCDLAALSVLDDIFLAPGAVDRDYRLVRDDAFIVAAACGHPGDTCFCASMDTGPTPRSDFDLAVVELYDDVGHEFLVEAGSDRGAALLTGLGGREVTYRDRSLAADRHGAATASMGRQLSASDPPRAAEHPDHPRWDDVAERCLACGNCTMVCPTCFCGATQDVTDLTGNETERWRVWDSCFTLDFSHLGNGSVRTSTKSRYRQWLLHKLVTWHDQFDRSGCVGCGRCITWCPVGIDLTEEIAALAKSVPAADRAEEPS